MGSINRIVFILVQVSFVFGALPQLKKCQVRDSNCLKSSFQEIIQILSAGVPDLGTKPLDPLRVKLITVDLSGLKMTVRNSVIQGLHGTVVDKLSINMDKKRILLDFHADLDVDGKYKASGRVMILPISGDGDSHVFLKNCKLSFDIAFDIGKDKNGQDVLELKSYRYKYDIKDGIGFKLGNLFNGNKQLSDSFHQFLNDNWKTLTTEFGGPLFDPPVKTFFETLKLLLKSYPMEEIIVI